MVPPTSPDPPLTLSQTTLTLVLQLVRREEYRFGPAMVRGNLERGAIGPDVSPDEAPLIAAAAAIGGGEPKRALRALSAHRFGPGSDGLAVAEALRRVALTLDRNWFPGGAGAVLEDGDLVTILGTPVPDAGATAALLVEVATDVVAMTPTWRSIVEGGRGSDPFGGTASTLGHVQMIGAQLVARGDASSVGYLATIHADLAVRAGKFKAASASSGPRLQAYQATSDAAGISSNPPGPRRLVGGAPVPSEETLGLDLEGQGGRPGLKRSSRDPRLRPTAVPPPGDDVKFTFAKAGRGLAAIELRLAHLDSLEGRRRRGADRIHAVVERAASIGDGSMTELARVHLALSMIEDDTADRSGVDRSRG